MKQLRPVMLSLLVVLLCNLFGQAQESVAPAANATVPPLIQFSNVATDEHGNSLSGVANITFSLYSAQRGGESLWAETQANVALDSTGHYSVELGIVKANGVPTALFTSGEARWLGVQIAGQEEQPRVLLLSVPYALKAGDAATIGGLPPSAFVLAAPNAGTDFSNAAVSAAESAAPPAGTTVTGTGTVNFIPLWSTTSNIVNSALFQSGSGSTVKVGINNSAPSATLDVGGSSILAGSVSLPSVGTAKSSAGQDSQPFELAASAFNSSSGKAVTQTFEWLAEPAGNDTGTPSATLNLLFGQGTAKPSETGLHIASNGVITFATGQTFGSGGGGGTGTVTSVGSGAGLTGGPITESGTLSIATGGVTNAMLATAYAQLNTANTFAGNQTLNGTLTATSASTTISATSTSTGEFAVVGSGGGAGLAGTASSTIGEGVYGSATATSGQTFGVIGLSDSPAGYGVYGANDSTSGIAVGTFGTSASPQGYGVYGAGAYGVYGLDSTGENNGVYGTSDAGFGVYGNSTSGYAVYGGSTNGYGVFGLGVNYVGVLGLSGSYSNTSEGINVVPGVWGDSGGTSGEFSGIVATADSNNALLAANNDASGSYPTMVVENYTSQTHNPVFQTSSPNTYSGARHCTIDTSANLTCTGVLSGVVQQGEAKQTAIYAMQSAENWLEDAGSGHLSNGSARIELDSAFAQTVNSEVEYHVFLTPNEDSRGLYVSHRTATSFEVHEQSGGTSTIAFDYRIMAKRKGYENLRLEDVTERFQQLPAPAHKARARSPLPSARPKPLSPMAAPPTRPILTPRPMPTAPKPVAVVSTQASSPTINQK